MEKKIDDVSVFLVNDKLLPNASVVIGFKYECNWFVLQKLIKGQPCLCLDLAYASENTCVAYAIFGAVKKKLIGSPLEQMKSKVSNMVCNYQNGEFIMSFSCPNNIPTIKKNLMAAMSKITPHKYYPMYSHNIKILNGKPLKNEFLYCVNILKNTNINIFIIGKFNIDTNKFSIMVDNINTKFSMLSAHAGGEKPRSLSKNMGVTGYPTNIARGYKSVFVRDFIENETGFYTVINSGKVIVYNTKWDVYSKKITEQSMKKYVEHKYTKLKNKFILVILYMVASECILDTVNMIKLYEDDPSPSVVFSYIKDAL